MDSQDRDLRFPRQVDRSLNQLVEDTRTTTTKFVLVEDTSMKAPRPTSGFLSKEQVDSHYDDHYLGYLKGLEEAQKQLASGNDPRSAMLKIAFNYNGALLHEIYFDCMGGKDFPKDLEKTLGPKDELLAKLEDAMMKARSGWAYLGFDERSGDFKVGMIDSHDCHIALWRPVLALDVWEHAYYIDFKTDKKKYVKGMLEDINWQAVSKRVNDIL